MADKLTETTWHISIPVSILIVLFCILVSIAVIIHFAFGETEKGCTIYRSQHLLVIGGDNKVGGCYWLVDKFLYNETGWHITGYADQPQGGVISENDIPATEKFILSKH